MKIELYPQQARTFIALAASGLIAISGGLWSSEALAQTEQPIAYIGHGAFFDHKGNEIHMTQAFVEKAQAWYRADLLSGLDERKKREFGEFEQRLYKGVQMKGQTRLVVRHRALEWLFANSPRHKDDDRTLGKLRALEYALSWRLPERPGQNIGDKREEFKHPPFSQNTRSKIRQKDRAPGWDGGVLVLNLLWRDCGACAPPWKSLPLTA